MSTPAFGVCWNLLGISYSALCDLAALRHGFVVVVRRSWKSRTVSVGARVVRFGHWLCPPRPHSGEKCLLGFFLGLADKIDI
jgi:hypothetical protein